MCLCDFGKQSIEIFHFRWPQKHIFRPLELSTQFHTFWPPCRSVSTVQSILNLVFTCLWFWRLRSFHYGTLSHICFLATGLLILTLGFFSYTPAADLYHQFYRFWHSRSMCINSSVDSESLYVRLLHWSWICAHSSTDSDIRHWELFVSAVSCDRWGADVCT